MQPLSPLRVVALALVATGALVIFANHVDADESRTIGAALVAMGVAGVCLSKRRGIKRMIEVLAVVVLILAGGEWTVRRENGIAQARYAARTMRFVDDSVLRYEWQPDISCGQGQTNDLGMLDRPRTLAKSQGALRVACLGDSVGGDCSLPTDNVCAELEQVLGGSRPVEALNFSTPGYNTLQEARSLELKAMKFSPDVVVVLYVLNDPFPDLAISHYLPGNFKFEHLLFSGAYLAYWKLTRPDEDPMAAMMAKLHDNPRAWDGVVVAGFDRIRAAADSLRIPVVVAVFPLFVPRPGPEAAIVHAKVIAEAERHGFIGVDLATAAFAAEPLEAWLKPSRDVIHPNAHAHRAAAEAIARALVAQRPDLAR